MPTSYKYYDHVPESLDRQEFRVDYSFSKALADKRYEAFAKALKDNGANSIAEALQAEKRVYVQKGFKAGVIIEFLWLCIKEIIPASGVVTAELVNTPHAVTNIKCTTILHFNISKACELVILAKKQEEDLDDLPF